MHRLVEFCVHFYDKYNKLRPNKEIKLKKIKNFYRINTIIKQNNRFNDVEIFD